MYWFAVTGASQKIGMKKLPVLSKILKKSMVIMGLALILYHNIKQFKNHDRCSKEKVQSQVKHTESIQVLAQLPFITAETKLGYYHHRQSVRVVPQVAARLKPQVLRKLGNFGGSPEIALNQNRNFGNRGKNCKIFATKTYHRSIYACLISRICLRFLSKIIYLENSSTLTG